MALMVVFLEELLKESQKKSVEIHKKNTPERAEERIEFFSRASGKITTDSKEIHRRTLKKSPEQLLGEV